MLHAPGRGRAFSFRHGPSLRSRGDKQLASSGSDLAHRNPIGRRCGAATGNLQTVFCEVDVTLLDPHVLPIHVEFFRDEHRQHGPYALTNFRILGGNGHDAFWRNAYEGIGSEHGGRWSLRRLRKGLLERIDVRREQQASSGHGSHAKKRATADSSDGPGLESFQGVHAGTARLYSRRATEQQLAGSGILRGRRAHRRTARTKILQAPQKNSF